MNASATWTELASSKVNRKLHALFRISDCGQIDVSDKIARCREIDHWLAVRYARTRKAA